MCEDRFRAGRSTLEGQRDDVYIQRALSEIELQ
jgi:hypothetical protein